jgi:hypothetical protein
MTTTQIIAFCISQTILIIACIIIHKNTVRKLDKISKELDKELLEQINASIELKRRSKRT